MTACWIYSGFQLGSCKRNQHAVLSDIHRAMSWINSHQHLLHGQEPAVLQMDPANQMKALVDVIEGQVDNEKDEFLITFQHQDDGNFLQTKCR